MLADNFCHSLVVTLTPVELEALTHHAQKLYVLMNMRYLYHVNNNGLHHVH